MGAIRRLASGVVCAFTLVGMARADEVTHWNEVLLDGFRTDFGVGCPCPLGRAGAMVHCAIFDAVNSIDRTRQPYLGFLPVWSSASKPAAVAAAAYRTMLNVFPNSMATLTAEYNSRLALIPNGQSKTNGIAAGEAAAARIIAARANDGSQVVEPYVFGGNPGDYRPTPPGFNPSCNPEWRDVTPFCMDRGNQYRSRGPLGYRHMSQLLRSRAYADQLNEVKIWGSLNSTLRTPEQTRIAFFWAVDANGTCKPPGHLFQLAQVLAADRNLSLSENARLFALVGLAMGDAGVVAWDMKYATSIDLWRPITAIREAHSDNNPWTTRDPNWEPLNPFTPPFPAYTSGHATFGAAACAAMAEFFGTDHITFTLDSEDPYYNALPSHPPRTFHRLSDAGWEDGLSRIYLGVHFRMDAVDGNRTGKQLGKSVGKNFLQPRCPADFNGDGRIRNSDLAGFFAAFQAQSPLADFNRDGQINGADVLGFLHAFHHHHGNC